MEAGRRDVAGATACAVGTSLVNTAIVALN